MTTNQLVQQIRKKNSFLCVGLDVDLKKIPSFLLKEEDPIFTFNKAIIDATSEYAVAFKPNIAFYEAHGLKGWKSLEKTIGYLNKNYPDLFTIADAKRGDIGNTSSMYAKTFLEELDFDSVTVAPYMGKDSVEPFLSIPNKHTILLALTSNEGAHDFQTKKSEDGLLYQQVLKTSQTWKNSDQLMYVIGATQADSFKEVREIVPDSFLLVPGVGAQGGNLQDVCKFGLTKDVGLLVNSSRGIIYASNDRDFNKAAGRAAHKIKMEMEYILSNNSNRVSG